MERDPPGRDDVSPLELGARLRGPGGSLLRRALVSRSAASMYSRASSSWPSARATRASASQSFARSAAPRVSAKLSFRAERASIKSAANCAACHTQADKGVFNDHDIRIPR